MKKFILALLAMGAMITFASCGEKTTAEKVEDVAKDAEKAAEGAKADAEKAAEELKK